MEPSARYYPLAPARCRASATLPSSRYVARRTARISGVLTCLVMAGPALMVLVACERQVLRLLPGAGPEAGAVPSEAPDVRAGCEHSSQCSRPLPFCDVPTGSCVGCLSSDDCNNPEECDPIAMHCALPCSRENDCRSTQSSESNHCNTNRGFCVECVADTDCSSRDPQYCDRESGQCVDCRGNCSTDRPQ